MNKFKTGIFQAAIATCLIGCAPVSTINTQPMPLPETYSEQAGTDTITAAHIGWQTFFPDTILQGYILKALENNHSFRNILERVSMAQNEVRLKKGTMFPSVYAGAGAGVQRYGRYTKDGIENRDINASGTASGSRVPDPYREFTLGIGFQWEADLWGKLNQRKKAAVNRWMASVEAARMAQTILISELANRYFELVALDQQHDIIRQAIKRTEASCELSIDLKEEGEITQLAVDQFKARLLKLKGMLLDNESNIRSVERALCLLMGIFPKPLDREYFERMENHRFMISTGVPAQLLTLRPDVKGAELELAATRCDVSAARKAFFPSLTLGGSGGFNAFDMAHWFASPASMAYNLVLGVTAPIFDRNQLKVMWRNAESNQRIALNHYHETILKAYEEVAGLLVESEYIAAHKDIQIKEMKICKTSIVNANDLFRLQYIGYLEVLSADTEYVESQLSYAELLMYYYKIHSHLYRALGGGVF